MTAQLRCEQRVLNLEDGIRILDFLQSRLWNLLLNLQLLRY